MIIKITKGKPLFSEVDHGKDVVFVEFPNCISTKTGRSFKWMPTYRELQEIDKALAEIEIESWGNIPNIDKRGLEKDVTRI